LAANAEVSIELNDGKIITVPVAKEDIRRITFTSAEKQSTAVIESQTRPHSTSPQTWRVGPDGDFQFPSDVAKIARDGDTVEIEAGSYENDYAVWRQNNITISGVGGMAHLKSESLIPNRKAIWILKGDNIIIENVEFSGAAVRDTNGAGIRHEGGNLTLRNTYFHDNEFSILAGKLPDARITIEDSRFWYQKRSKRYSHGIYIGEVAQFRLTGSHFKGTDRGHQIKSRALENLIMYNRIEDVPSGNSSRLIDLSNCGMSVIMGNDMHQAITAENFDAIGYGAEGCEKRNEQQMKLYVINNTFINEANSGAMVNNHAGGDVLVTNNLMFGEGSFLSGNGKVSSNVRLPLKKRIENSWAAPRDSAAVDGALELPYAQGLSLIPTREFNPPTGTRDRPKKSILDAGSNELNY
jgi:hypothetical protein